VFALLNQAKITAREDRLNLFRWILHDRGISSTHDLSVTDLQGLIDMLEYWQREGELESMARQHTGPQ